MKPRLVEVRQKILKQNDVTARQLRDQFQDAGVFVVSLVSSPGAGKTAFLERTLKELIDRGERVAALVGDLATDNDAVRLSRSGAPVRQIVTGTVCHLEADMVRQALGDWKIAKLDFLFIENVGNLVCPASYDLGENLRAVLMSTTEGEDKPLKYPTIFNTADLAIITKIDLADAVEFDRASAGKYSIGSSGNDDARSLIQNWRGNGKLDGISDSAVRCGERGEKSMNLRARIFWIYLLLFFVNIAAWVWAFVAFAHFPLLLGTALLAYSFGLRHAVDADHIAAIDNVTRKLMQEGKRPVAVGFFFSLGHSTIVILASAAVAATAMLLRIISAP